MAHSENGVLSSAKKKWANASWKDMEKVKHITSSEISQYAKVTQSGSNYDILGKAKVWQRYSKTGGCQWRRGNWKGK